MEHFVPGAEVGGHLPNPNRYALAHASHILKQVLTCNPTLQSSHPPSRPLYGPTQRPYCTSGPVDPGEAERGGNSFRSEVTTLPDTSAGLLVTARAKPVIDTRKK